jgi:outer membrane protein assembly factor BamA
VDNNLNPKQGFKWYNSAEIRTLPFEDFKHYTQLSSVWRLYVSPSISPQLTFALQSGIRHNIGEFPFYAQNTLGGLNSLRGFQGRRFAGRTAWFNNAEIRQELLDVQTDISAFTLGGLLFADGGKVWADGEQSKLFHANFGVGGWILIPETAVISGGVSFSKEHKGYIHGKIGFMF